MSKDFTTGDISSRNSHTTVIVDIGGLYLQMASNKWEDRNYISLVVHSGNVLL